MSGDFDKTIGRLRIVSFGGGSPRWVRILTDSDSFRIENLSMDETKDLHYALGRLIELDDRS